MTIWWPSKRLPIGIIHSNHHFSCNPLKYYLAYNYRSLPFNNSRRRLIWNMLDTIISFYCNVMFNSHVTKLLSVQRKCDYYQTARQLNLKRRIATHAHFSGVVKLINLHFYCASLPQNKITYYYTIIRSIINPTGVNFSRFPTTKNVIIWWNSA